MATKVLVPRLGEGVDEVTVTKWLKQVGDSVRELEPLLEVNTDKVDTEIPCLSGVILKIEMQEGQAAKVEVASDHRGGGRIGQQRAMSIDSNKSAQRLLYLLRLGATANRPFPTIKRQQESAVSRLWQNRCRAWRGFIASEWHWLEWAYYEE